jgi:5-formyltetrahydrofolate cyclo-ligase
VRRDTPTSKPSLRREIKQRLSLLSPDDFRVQGEGAAALLRESPHWARYGAIFLFLSLPGEIDTRPLVETALEAGKRVFAPRIDAAKKGAGDMKFYRVFPREDPVARDPPGACGTCGFLPPLTAKISDFRAPLGARKVEHAQNYACSLSSGLISHGLLVPGPLGIREPAPLEPSGPADFPALIVVPGLAFDRQGRRLGRGGGYYDRFLTAIEGTCPGTAGRIIGLCVPSQIVREVPVEPWDHRVDGVCTGEQLLEFA